MAKQLGEVCTGASECDSNACADGVCCDRACTEGCERCDKTGSVGTCGLTGDASKCGLRCLDASQYQELRCDGQSPACQSTGSGASSCGGAGCLVLPSGKAVCAKCSDAVPCEDSLRVCRDGVCVDPTPKPPAPVQCKQDADCGSPDLVCAAEVCQARGTSSAFASIEPLPLDESCGCRVPGAAGGIEAVPGGVFGSLCAALVLLRRRRTRRARGLLLAVFAAALTLGAISSSGCSPQEDLPANQACVDTPIALSAVVLACTDDYDAARRVGNGFEGKYRCNATDVADTPRYYRCPADLRKLPCADVKAANEDYEQLLGRSNACRLLFSHLDGTALPPVALLSPDGVGGAGGGGGADGIDNAGAAGVAGSTP